MNHNFKFVEPIDKIKHDSQNPFYAMLDRDGMNRLWWCKML